MSLVMDVPTGTIAVVLFEHGDHGELLARYAEGRERVPAPRRQVIDALLHLLLELESQANSLDAAAHESEKTE